MTFVEGDPTSCWGHAFSDKNDNGLLDIFEPEYSNNCTWNPFYKAPEPDPIDTDGNGWLSADEFENNPFYQGYVDYMENDSGLNLSAEDLRTFTAYIFRTDAYEGANNKTDFLDIFYPDGKHFTPPENLSEIVPLYLDEDIDQIPNIIDTDQDNDTLLDSTENGTQGAYDFDKDGFSDIHETTMGTDPMDAASHPQFLGAPDESSILNLHDTNVQNISDANLIMFPIRHDVRGGQMWTDTMDEISLLLANLDSQNDDKYVVLLETVDTGAVLPEEYMRNTERIYFSDDFLVTGWEGHPSDDIYSNTANSGTTPYMQTYLHMIDGQSSADSLSHQLGLPYEYTNTSDPQYGKDPNVTKIIDYYNRYNELNSLRNESMIDSIREYQDKDEEYKVVVVTGASHYTGATNVRDFIKGPGQNYVVIGNQEGMIGDQSFK